MRQSEEFRCHLLLNGQKFFFANKILMYPTPCAPNIV